MRIFIDAMYCRQLTNAILYKLIESFDINRKKYAR